MTMTNEQLEEAVARIAELDAKRTQGEWRTSPYSDPRVFWEGSREALASCNEGILFTEYPAEDNAAFIATAPLMVRIIRQLWEEREGQRAIMAQAKEALRYYRDEEWLGGKDGVAAQAHAALESVGV